VTPPLRVLIVEDEPVARALLAAMLAEIGGLEVVGECRDAAEAVAEIRARRPDLVFLDIQLPGGDGFSVIEAIGVEEMPTVVFVTAYDQYALRAFEVMAADYLLKPFDEERLQGTVKRAIKRFEEGRQRQQPELLALLEALGARRSHAQRLAVTAGDHVAFVAAAEISWLEARGKHVVVHSSHGSHTVREGLSRVASRLDPEQFLRIHRSVVVRIDRVREVHRWFRGGYLLVLSDGTRLQSGASYRRAVESALLGTQRPAG
jgi:two-component system, LytTR family, response regulator